MNRLLPFFDGLGRPLGEVVICHVWYCLNRRCRKVAKVCPDVMEIGCRCKTPLLQLHPTLVSYPRGEGT